jgi:hypothetical protein
LRQEQEDRITWTLTPHGEYTAASAYIAQFNGCVAAPDVAIIWKTWAPQVQTFRLVDISEQSVDFWQTSAQGVGPLPVLPPFRQTMETAHHLLASCRYTHRVRDLVAKWAGLTELLRHTELRPTTWPASRSPRWWWKNLSNLPEVPRKGARSLILLVIWEVWKERWQSLQPQRGCTNIHSCEN